VLLCGGEPLPLAHSLTAPNVNDIDEAVKLPIEAGAIYVFDKGYCDYNWWARINATGACFVTRFKRNAALRVECDLPRAPGEAAGVLSDSLVRLAHRHPRGGKRNLYTARLRRIVIDRPDKDTPLVLATNDLSSPAALIAQRYRQRWEIETFFKWIKQHLKIRRFLGRSENAVRIQLLCALIAYLLLAAYRRSHAITTSLWELLAELRTTLFQRPALEAHLYRRRRERLQALAALQPSLFP
jgi:putative transposase